MSDVAYNKLFARRWISVYAAFTGLVSVPVGFIEPAKQAYICWQLLLLLLLIGKF